MDSLLLLIYEYSNWQFRHECRNLIQEIVNEKSSSRGKSGMKLCLWKKRCQQSAESTMFLSATNEPNHFSDT